MALSVASSGLRLGLTSESWQLAAKVRRLEYHGFSRMAPSIVIGPGKQGRATRTQFNKMLTRWYFRSENSDYG